MNTQYSSLEEVWGTAFPKKSHTMMSSKHTPEPKRDAEKEGRTFPTPVHRGNAAIQTHKKTIDDLTSSLPISQDDEESNYAPAKVSTKEHFSATKTYRTPPFYSPDAGTDFAYAPTSFQTDAHEIKLNRILSMIEQNQTGYETPATQDMLLYIFTGVFFLFTFDTFVNLGKRVR